eukprot:RCo035689
MSNPCREEIDEFRNCLQRTDYKVERCGAQDRKKERCLERWREKNRIETVKHDTAVVRPPPECRALACAIEGCMKKFNFDLDKCQYAVDEFKSCVEKHNKSARAETQP